jgi:hypothetical protein
MVEHPSISIFYTLGLASFDDATLTLSDKNIASLTTLEKVEKAE